ncbi:MAG TPA: arginase family protein, partial [bacterium]|nr:arginase family protein [bacterium]
PVPGGLTYRETHLAMESLCDSKKVISAEIVETNPILDIKNTTAHVGVEMMASLFGKRIM